MNDLERKLHFLQLRNNFIEKKLDCSSTYSDYCLIRLLDNGYENEYTLIQFIELCHGENSCSMYKVHNILNSIMIKYFVKEATDISTRNNEMKEYQYYLDLTLGEIKHVLHETYGG